MSKPERKTILKVLDVARTIIIAVLAVAVVAESGLLEGACAEKAYADTATSQSLAKGVGKVSQYNNGSYVHDFNEGVLGVNGEVAFCMDPNVDFKSGTVTSFDILSVVSQAQLTDIALRAHYLRDVYQDNWLSTNARIILAQTLVWEVLSPSQSFVVVAAENGGGFAELSAAVREDACAKARAFAAANASRYDSYGTLWRNGSTQPVATFGCQLVVGTIDLVKRSANPSVSDGNGLYALSGATYGIYADASCTALAARLITDGSGYAKSDELRMGPYYVRELTAPSGFAVDGTVYPVTVSAGQTVRVGGNVVYDSPVSRTGLAALDKHDAEIGWHPDPSGALGSATLTGATYQVEHYDGLFGSVQEAAASGAPKATWQFATDSDGRIDLSAPDGFLVSGTLYHDTNGKAVFPLGTYVIREAAPSEGYLLSADALVLRVAQDGNGVRMEGDFREADGREVMSAAEQVKRCDLSLTKVRESDMTRLAGIPFTLTSETTGESHVIVTDDNGRVDTSAGWNKHTAKTNANDVAVREDGTVDEEALDANAGVWFGQQPDGAATQPSDGLGALPYDTYTLQELSCSGNAGLVLVKMSGIVAKRNGVTMDLGTVDDKEVPPPSIATVAYDAADSDKQVQAGEGAIVRDEVELTDLVPGRTYTLYGTVIDKRTGLPVLAGRGLSIDAEGAGSREEPAEDEAIEDGLQLLAMDGGVPESDEAADADDVEDDDASDAEASDVEDVQAEDLQEFWDGLVELIGAKRVPSLAGFSYEIGTSETMDADEVGTYLARNEGFASQMVMASLEFEADAPTMVTALEYEMDSSSMEGDYVIYDLLVADDGTMAAHADSENDRESFTVEQPEEPLGKGYYKTGNGLEWPGGASGMMAAGTVLGAGIVFVRRLGWNCVKGLGHAR